jgi:hypothetical protein
LDINKIEEFASANKDLFTNKEKYDNTEKKYFEEEE